MRIKLSLDARRGNGRAAGSSRLQSHNRPPSAPMDDTGFSYFDEYGTARAVMNELGFTYYDENGNVVWSTDCAPNC